MNYEIIDKLATLPRYEGKIDALKSARESNILNLYVRPPA